MSETDADAVTGCRPPREFEGYDWHWVVHSDGRPQIAQWSNARCDWSVGSTRFFGAIDADKSGWRYVAPAIPPEIKVEPLG